MAMADMQLYFAIGLPVFAFLVNIAAGIVQTNSIHARITSVETGLNARIASLEGRLMSLETSVNARFVSLETSVNARFASFETRFDTLIGKVIEIDSRH